MICPVCPHYCRLEEGGAPGRCRARALKGGVNKAVNYGAVTAMALDPIEKKPLRRFFPGSLILSVGSFGCNMDCYFCQNDHIAAADKDSVSWAYWAPRRLAQAAQALKSRGNIGVAFTYNEPLVGFEYLVDTTRLLRANGLKAVAVTNGCFFTRPMKELFPLIDAWNIDLKGFSQGWYSRLGGDLNTVRAFIREAHRHGHVELTTLVVPGENDTVAEMDRLAGWVASLSEDIPLHVSRFFPRGRALDAKPTDRNALEALADTARGHLKHVYTGNV